MLTFPLAFPSWEQWRRFARGGFVGIEANTAMARM